MAKGKSLLIGFITGGIVAGAATLLTAPRSGEQLRKNARTCGEQVIHSLHHLKEEGMAFKEQVEKTSKESAVIIKDFSEDLKRSIDQWKKEIEPHKQKIQEELRKIEKTMDELEQSTKKKQELSE